MMRAPCLLPMPLADRGEHLVKRRNRRKLFGLQSSDSLEEHDDAPSITQESQ